MELSNIRKIYKHYNPDYNGEDKVCCPFHGETTASFTFYDHNNTYWCYGGGQECGSSMEDFVILSEELDMQTDYRKGKAIAAEILGVSEEVFGEEKKRVTNVQQSIDCLPAMPKEDIKAFLSDAVRGYGGNGYRGIKDEYLRFFGHVTKLDESGKVKSRHYPETNTQGLVAGYKCRNHPKDFRYGNVGHTGGKNQLSGQVKFTSGGKYILIVGGEEDKVAAYQMLADSQKDKDYDSIAVVSPTCGETSAVKQVANNFAFFDTFETIRIGMDNDEAGRKAAALIAAVLPKDKVEIVTWSGKDPNQMLLDGKEKQFVRDFWNARQLVNSGIKESSGLMDAVREELQRPRITLPPHWHAVQAATKGGFLQGRIINIIGDTSVGKSTHVNDLVYYWMFNAPEKVGVVSLEATDGQYTLDLLSIHLEKNLLWIGEGKDILEYLDRPDVQALYDNLLTHDDGRPRFSILDERDGDIKMLEKQMEKLVNQHGCKILVVDVLTDILRGMDKDAQEEHMKFQKRMVKTGVTIINVLHTRKPSGGDGEWKMPTEYDAFGSSTFVQSAAINIVIGRNKMATCPIERNRTYVHMPKCRGGETGEITSFQYDVVSRMVMDYNDWTRKNMASYVAPEASVDNSDPGF
ncbi:putative primase/helicase [Pseudomonas phage phiPMW]|uniref:Putative primase/helicase n=1 Tax=Pseudomonas phage phiPMW TaxID=1815582 RepID=A0A1S5R1P7_9CAUD|nr:DNA primase/helicase [Pseudomonas phage phiPMW]ANA49319.1 putative primase/helicase [Pseudomonas phage phiPMW]